MNEPKGAGAPPTDFLRQIVAADTDSGRFGGSVVTRFPPEPNGYLHLGHVKSICLNFGIAADFGGRCHLRYDDTNPEKENEEYVLGMQEDIRWLGFDWGEHLYFASDYFGQMYDFAEVLINKGLAYVDSQSTEAIREGRGTVTESGVSSPDRERPVEENLDLFRRMRAGDFGDGAHVLRAKIDMGAANMIMRDPVLYRIRHAHHYRQGDDWCLYPLYDYAHCLEDALEGVTHSLCTLEFENNRALYDWVLDNVGFEEPRSHQYEFAELVVEHAVLSKRRILPLVQAGVVSGWDDPRLSTVRGFRRRGVPPEALRRFIEMVGVARTHSTVDVAKFDFSIREVLNQSAPRVMAVLDPLRVVLTNYPEGTSETLDAPYYPHDVPLEGSRELPFGRELFIERSDFAEDPPKGFRRLRPGGEVRLRYGYVIRCDEVVRGYGGEVLELRCTYDPETRSGSTGDGRKVQGTIHWVSAAHALDAEIRLYDRLFLDAAEVEEDDAESDLLTLVNPGSLRCITGAKVEPSVADDAPDVRYQFERTGYFWRDPVDGVGDSLVFNRIVTLKDSWVKRGTVSVEKPKSQPKRGAGAGQGDRPVVSDERASLRSTNAAMAARFERYQADWGVSAEHADLLTDSLATADFFEAAVAGHPNPTGLAAWMVTDLRGLLGARALPELPITGAALGRLVALVDSGRLTRRAGKDVLARLAADGGDPEALMTEMGLERVGDEDALQKAVETVLSAWPEKVEEYRAGKRNLIGLFVGEVMKATGGAADPQSVRKILTQHLEN
ncbi:MAG: glutamine--tRNA ligase/YqeY domain fusion protein [Gemmatimonadetes bacterium]|nr:glutamine--tRNA ligase/YqeY domain fusion protein [Gemmatimonadota bacterium]